MQRIHDSKAELAGQIISGRYQLWRVHPGSYACEESLISVAPNMGSCHNDVRIMRIISRKTLRLFWEKPEYADAEQSLKAWFREASNADWTSPAAIKGAFGTASIVANNRVVFNIGGNKYRLVVKVNYPYRVLYVRFIGTHAQYDRIDVDEV